MSWLYEWGGFIKELGCFLYKNEFVYGYGTRLMPLSVDALFALSAYHIYFN